MLPHVRRRLFYGLLLLFFFFGGGAIAYSQGWRLDIRTFHLKKVGAIYIRSFPKEASIYLNGKLIKNEAGLFQPGTLINNLFPQQYRLRLSSEGYRDWETRVPVEPSLVSEYKYAVLILDQADLVSDGPIENFWIVGESTATQTRGKLAVRDRAIEGDNIVGWKADGSKILSFDSRRKAYFWGGGESSAPMNVSAALLAASTSTARKEWVLAVDRSTDASLIALGSSSLALFLPSEPALEYLDREGGDPVVAAAASPSWLGWSTFRQSDSSSVLLLYDKLSRNSRADGVLVAGRTKKMEWGSNTRLGLLQDDGGLYLYTTRDGALQKIASDVKDFAFSRDASMLAALEYKSLEVFSLGGKREYWRFNLRDVETARGLQWYKDGRHLFIMYPDEIRFLDLDDASQENFKAVAKTARAIYAPPRNELYFLTDGKLFKLGFPE